MYKYSFVVDETVFSGTTPVIDTSRIHRMTITGVVGATLDILADGISMQIGIKQTSPIEEWLVEPFEVSELVRHGTDTLTANGGRDYLTVAYKMVVPDVILGDTVELYNQWNSIRAPYLGYLSAIAHVISYDPPADEESV